jgi:hypothetical protein
VTALNNHVVRRNPSYDNVNEFLDANNADSPANNLDAQFVEMSNTLGYDINASYSE